MLVYDHQETKENNRSSGKDKQVRTMNAQTADAAMLKSKKKAKTKTKSNWLDPNTTADNERLPRYAKWAWSSRGISLALNVILIMQLTYYCTDMLGMKPGLVGMLLLVSKIFDGVTDLIVGFIIDKTNTKFGKARPYEIFIVFVWVFTALLFAAPNLSTTGLAVYVFVLYTLINSVCATFLNGNDAVYLSRSFRSEGNRVSVMSFNGSLIMLLSIIFNIIMPQLVAGIGSTREGWIIIGLAFAVPLGILGIFRFVFIKEVAVTEVHEQQEKENHLSLKDSIRSAAGNKYIFILAGMTFLVQLMTNIGSATSTYYFKYIIGNIGLATYISMVSLVTPIVIALFPKLTRKFGSVKIMQVGTGIAVLGYALRTIGGTNIITLMLGSLLGSIGVLPLTMMINIYVIDCMDYGEWKTGTRVEGMLGSINGFCYKLGSGIASGLVGVVMGAAGYDGSLAVQSAAANTSIVALYNWVPLVLTVIMLVLAMMYKLDKLMPQIKADLAEKRAENN